MTQEIMNWVTSLTWKDGLISLGICIVFVVLGRPFTTFLLKIVTHFTQKTRTKIDDHFIESFHKPIYYLIGLSGLYFALNYLGLPPKLDQVLLKLYRTSIILCIGAGLFKLCNSTELFFGHFNKRLNLQFDRIVIPFLTRILKFIVIALMVTMALAEWGYSINGFVAGLGLAGLAISLAAKDTASNFIGGFIIITETPFSIGDWIMTPSVEGVVEDISFRSTKIRTFADALVAIPNSTLANEAITNWTKMNKRQLTFEIELDLRTPRDRIEACLKDIREMLHNNEAIDKDAIFVHFKDMKTTGYTLYFYFFTKTTVWEEWLTIRESVNLEVLKILEAHHVELSIPGRTVFYQNDHPSDALERSRDS
ncbi:MscS family membrane protein [Pullulanibacillus pueri]|uniref:Putative MscS family protein YhdY n=1 Tax=Pullulanibacillus pueri TaxID=1437324 RepID=A0A8J3ELI2_9BACL|nr:mechanosensitive ion channel family protein [Pullulanibacillus pueri]MBM7681607.1 MscS family membrane protein [Pullulanibacillus pueri]GGH79478.1 putative MscS family protein YhdY [Pullulanibacillus pueri]